MRVLGYTLSRFLLVGIANTIVGLTVIYLCMALLGFGVVSANAAGYAVGFVHGFILNRGWTFQHTANPGPAMLRYGVVSVVAYLANLATVTMLASWTGMNPYLAQALGIAPYTTIAYLGSRYFAFPKRAETPSTG